MSNIGNYPNKWVLYKGFHEHGRWVSNAFLQIYRNIGSPLAYNRAITSVAHATGADI